MQDTSLHAPSAPPVALTRSEEKTLAYYGREAAGIPEPASTPLAGLSLSAFRAAREGLVRKGMLIRDTRGRYVPVGR